MTVMIGIDPHKRSHTAVALDEHDEMLDQMRIDADPRQVRRLLDWAARWPDRVWAIENATGWGGCCHASSSTPANRSVTSPRHSRRRSGSCPGPGTRPTPTTHVRPRSRDATRGCSGGRAGRGAQLLGLLIERRWQIVSARQKTLVRIHEQLTKLVPGLSEAVVGRQGRTAPADHPSR